MKQCTNQQCAHYLRSGNYAEYNDGITHCADCASELSFHEQQDVDDVEAIGTVTWELLGRLAVTIAVATIPIFLRYVTIPGINTATLERLRMNNHTAHTSGSVALMGLTPYIAAALCVELAAVLLPPLRRLRSDALAGRRKLYKWTLVFSVLFSGMQAWIWCFFIATNAELKSAGAILDGGVVLTLGPPVLVGATLLLIALVHINNRYGLGQGVSIVIGSALAVTVVNFVWSEITAHFGTLDSFIHSAIWQLVGAAMIVIIVVRVTAPIPFRWLFAKAGAETFGLSCPTGGLLPLFFVWWSAKALLYWPEFFSEITKNVFQPGDVVRGGRWLLPFLAYGLGAIVFREAKVFSATQRWPRHDSRADWEVDQSRVYFRRLAMRYHVLSYFFLSVIFALATTHGVDNGYGYRPEVIAWVILIYIGKDLIAEWRMRRRHSKLTKVWELHQVHDFYAVRNRLESAGISVLLRGEYHRRLWCFLGPYLPVDVLVPNNWAHLAEVNCSQTSDNNIADDSNHCSKAVLEITATSTD